MARFFKKFSPSTPVVLADNQRIAFSTLDNKTGYHATQSEAVAAEFEGFMRAEKYGLTEITWDEYNADYVVKKNNGTVRPRQFREELSPSAFKRLAAQDRPAGASPAVVNLPQAVVAEAASVPKIAPTQPEFKPLTGQRRGRAKTA